MYSNILTCIWSPNCFAHGQFRFVQTVFSVGGRIICQQVEVVRDLVHGLTVALCTCIVQLKLVAIGIHCVVCLVLLFVAGVSYIS